MFQQTHVFFHLFCLKPFSFVHLLTYLFGASKKILLELCDIVKKREKNVIF